MLELNCYRLYFYWLFFFIIVYLKFYFSNFKKIITKNSFICKFTFDIDSFLVYFSKIISFTIGFFRWFFIILMPNLYNLNKFICDHIFLFFLQIFVIHCIGLKKIISFSNFYSILLSKFNLCMYQILHFYLTKRRVPNCNFFQI